MVKPAQSVIRIIGSLFSERLLHRTLKRMIHLPGHSPTV
jgi:hypothetical protein